MKNEEHWESICFKPFTRQTNISSRNLVGFKGFLCKKCSDLTKTNTIEAEAKNVQVGQFIVGLKVNLIIAQIEFDKIGSLLEVFRAV